MFETVIVNADLERPEVPESPTTIAEVTAADIQQRNVASIGQALELLPGVQFRVARSKSEEQVTIRGFEQDKALVLMDGIRVRWIVLQSRTSTFPTLPTIPMSFPIGRRTNSAWK